MTAMFKQYKQKKKRAVNPDAPPRPTLLGQVKDLRETKSSIEELQFVVAQQRREIDQVNTKLRRAEYNISLLAAHLRKQK